VRHSYGLVLLTGATTVCNQEATEFYRVNGIGLPRIEAMLQRIEGRRLVTVLAVLQLSFLLSSLLFVTPAVAQQGEFQGTYDMWMDLSGIELEAEIHIYRYNSTDSLETYFGTYTPYHVSYRPNYRLQSDSSGYIDISNQRSYSNANGDLIRSETTYTVRLSGYQQVTFTSMYEYGEYVTLTDNATLYEETYLERYYEDGAYVSSTYYHEYTFLAMDYDDEVYTEWVTVDAGDFYCIVLDNYVFEGTDTDIDNPDDWDYYQGGYLAWIDLDEGHLVKQRQFDEYDDIVGSMSLKSLDAPAQQLLGGDMATMLLIAGGGIGAVAVVGAVLFVRSRRRSEVMYPPAPSVEWG
jgi:hypothetical protein